MTSARSGPSGRTSRPPRRTRSAWPRRRRRTAPTSSPPPRSGFGEFNFLGGHRVSRTSGFSPREKEEKPPNRADMKPVGLGGGFPCGPFVPVQRRPFFFPGEEKDDASALRSKAREDFLATLKDQLDPFPETKPCFGQPIGAMGFCSTDWPLVWIGGKRAWMCTSGRGYVGTCTHPGAKPHGRKLINALRLDSLVWRGI